MSDIFNEALRGARMMEGLVRENETFEVIEGQGVLNPKKTPWVVVSDGRIKAALTRPDSKAAVKAKRAGDVVASLNPDAFGKNFELRIGDRVKISAGQVLPESKQPKLGSGERFKNLVGQLKKNPDIEDPEAVAAAIGRKKYGAKKMAQMAAAGRNEGVGSRGFGEASEDVEAIVSQLVKSHPTKAARQGSSWWVVFDGEEFDWREVQDGRDLFPPLVQVLPFGRKLTPRSINQAIGSLKAELAYTLHNKKVRSSESVFDDGDPYVEESDLACLGLSEAGSYRQRAAGKTPHSSLHLRMRGTKFRDYADFLYPLEGDPRQLDAWAREDEDMMVTSAALKYLEQDISFNPSKLYHKVKVSVTPDKIRVRLITRQKDMYDDNRIDDILYELEDMVSFSILRTVNEHPELAYLFTGSTEGRIGKTDLNPDVEIG